MSLPSGRRRLALEECRRRRPGLAGLGVHASPNAVGAYERLGFRHTGAEEVEHGIRFVPMARPAG